MTQVFGNKRTIATFVLPTFLLFVVVGLVPIVMSVYYSLLKWDGLQLPDFVGLSNYYDLFVTDNFGVMFGNSILNSVILAVLSVVIQLPIALLLAIVLATGIKGEKVYRTVFFLPVVVSSAVIGVLFLKIYTPDFGVLNTLLDAVGLSSLKHDWLADESTALVAILLPIIWQYIGYHMLLMYAAIKGIPDELFEAAKIDGASATRTAFSITIPMITPILRVCTIFAVIGSLKIFDAVYVMTSGLAYPPTDVPSTLMYSMLFKRQNYGSGSAMAIFLVAECLVFYLVLQKGFKSKVEKELGL